MLSFIKDWVLNIVALVLFIVLIEMVLPSGRMKKYVGLVTGVVLIIAIINPFVRLLGGDVPLTEVQAANSDFLDRTEIKNDSKLLKEEQMKQITEVYRKKLISQLEAAAMNTEGVSEAKADVIINEDYNSDMFGEVKRVYLEIRTKDGKGSSKPVAQIDKIEVGIEPDRNFPAKGGDVTNGGGKAEGKKAEGREPDPALSKRIEDKISSLYGIERENIVISLPKE